MKPIFAGLAITAVLLFVMVWLVTSRRELSIKRQCMEHAHAELNLHRSLYEAQRDGPQREQAAHMLDISRRLYNQSLRTYQLTLQAPRYRIPGALLGFYPGTREAEL